MAAGSLKIGAPAGGDLTGAYPNPSIAQNAVNGNKIADNSLTVDDLGFPLGIGGKADTTPLPVQQGEFVEVISESFTMRRPGDVQLTGAVEVIDDGQSAGPTNATVRVVIDQTVQPVAFSGQIPPATSEAIPVVIQENGVAEGEHKIAVEVKAEEVGSMVGDRSIVGIVGPMY